MASLIPNLSSSLLPQPTSKSSSHQASPRYLPSRPVLSPLLLSSSSTSSSSSSSCPLTKLESPPTARTVPENGPAREHGDDRKNDFYINVGLAVRTLREDLPLLFSKDLNYDIYRDDITFTDPLNTFMGIEKYKLIFWALRFHGRILFREISFEIFRVWQPSENAILIRWNLRGVPRVPWETKGQFQGTSRYKLDRNGKIYEHKVDNLAFNFPQQLMPATSVLDMVTAQPASPNLTFLWGPTNAYTSSWLELYRAVRNTLDGEDYLVGQEGLVTCS